MQRRHGEVKRFSIGEDVPVGPPADALSPPTGNHTISPAHATAAEAETVFRFSLMFRDPKLEEHRPDPQALNELGLSMEELADSGDHPSLPAGYTYLGQFIAHDMSFTPKMDLLGASIALETVKNMSSPSLDLDGLYGLGPELESQHPSGRKIYEADQIRLRVGPTVSDLAAAAGVAGRFFNDLPRSDKDPKRMAVIPDERNDDNLAVAQTHVAFLKFHNAVVQHLTGKVQNNKLFVEAQNRVVRHYQWIILKDFLPRIIEKEVLEDVITNGCQHLKPEQSGALFTPVEFAAAAFRLGHSLIRESYEWNRLPSSSSTQRADLRRLFSLTGLRGTLLGNHKLPSSWIIDWTRFYDFSGFAGVEQHAHFNFARKIDTSLTTPLKNLSFLTDQQQDLRSLAVRNLQSGRLFGLPAGQSVAERLKVQNPLTPDEILDGANGPHREVLQKHKLHVLTPLWYYILKEAETRHGGERLGPVGSRIVAETFVALIKHSRISILTQEGENTLIWEPDSDPHPLMPEKPKEFRMTDLLYFTQRVLQDRHLNPLGVEA